ncbi:unnamed protein product [Albugo candida]|uniref:Uncharacterized protein n=1 Tax=Albugo candida TaxID=65357 RepID=A0A024GSY7_9STRA|nr:unnamed protein product [Albugo candida]|eukprot:CCI49899.1 unnamed protein product [Albugo candida]
MAQLSSKVAPTRKSNALVNVLAHAERLRSELGKQNTETLSTQTSELTIGQRKQRFTSRVHYLMSAKVTAVCLRRTVPFRKTKRELQRECESLSKWLNTRFTETMSQSVRCRRHSIASALNKQPQKRRASCRLRSHRRTSLHATFPGASELTTKQ